MPFSGVPVGAEDTGSAAGRGLGRALVPARGLENWGAAFAGVAAGGAVAAGVVEIGLVILN